MFSRGIVNTSVEEKVCHFGVAHDVPGYMEQTYIGRLPLLPRDQCRSEALYPLLDWYLGWRQDAFENCGQGFRADG